jgi:arabinose-5-phosphate isomerase
MGLEGGSAMDNGIAQDDTNGVTRTIGHAVDGLQQLHEALTAGPLGMAVENAIRSLLALDGRLIVTGVGKSGHVGAKLAATLASTGTPAFFVHPTEASHGDLGMIGRGDAVLALSWSGETRELGDIVAYTRRFRIPLLALTGGADSMLAKAADVAMILPRAPEACPHNLAPTTSTTLQLVLGDALAVALLERRGFSAHDFRDLHPGGKLGERLKTLEAIMLTGEVMPLIGPTASVGDAVDAISSKGFGIVGIVEETGGLAGVITDGDIRRFVDDRADAPLRSALNDTLAVDAMTHHPVVAAPDMLAASAVATMQERKISAMFVVADGRPVGIVTLLQFLQTGVV